MNCSSVGQPPLIPQLGRYVVIGFSTTVLDFALLNLFLLLVASRSSTALVLMSTSAYLLSLLAAYIGHRRWTFHFHVPGDKRSVMRFALLNAMTLALNALVVLVLTSSFERMIGPVLLANGSKAVATLISGSANFLGNRVWVFPFFRR